MTVRPRRSSGDISPSAGRSGSRKPSEFRGSLLTFERKTLLYPLSPVTTGDDNETSDGDTAYAVSVIRFDGLDLVGRRDPP